MRVPMDDENTMHFWYHAYTPPPGASDQGIAMYRRMLRREMKKVERGEDPMGVIRDEARNQRIDLPNEKGKKHFRGSFRTFVSRTHVRFSPIADALGLVFEP